MICSSSILIFYIQVNIPALTMSICRIIHTELLHTVLFRFAITHGAFSFFTTHGAFSFNERAPWQRRFLPGNRLRPFTTHGARGASRCSRCFFGTPVFSFVFVFQSYRSGSFILRYKIGDEGTIDSEFKMFSYDCHFTFTYLSFI